MLILYNERYLDLLDEKASSFLTKEVYDLIHDINEHLWFDEFDETSETQSFRQEVVERSRFLSFAIQTGQPTDTVFQMESTRVDEPKNCWYELD